jgi:hypothetical protein
VSSAWSSSNVSRRRSRVERMVKDVATVEARRAAAIEGWESALLAR